MQVGAGNEGLHKSLEIKEYLVKANTAGGATATPGKVSPCATLRAY